MARWKWCIRRIVSSSPLSIVSVGHRLPGTANGSLKHRASVSNWGKHGARDIRPSEAEKALLPWKGWHGRKWKMWLLCACSPAVWLFLITTGHRLVIQSALPRLWLTAVRQDLYERVIGYFCPLSKQISTQSCCILPQGNGAQQYIYVYSGYHTKKRFGSEYNYNDRMADWIYCPKFAHHLDPDEAVKNILVPQ